MFFSDNAKWKQEENGSSPHTHCICSSCILNTRAQTELIELSVKYIIMLRTLPQFAFQSTYYTEQNLYPSPLVRPCQGGPMSPVWILKRLVSVFIKMLVAYCRLCRHCRNLAEGACLLSIFHFTRCYSFLGHVACQNLPWQDLIGLTGIRLEDGLQAFLKKNNKEHIIDVQFVRHLPMTKLRQKNNGESNNVHCCTIYI